MYTRLPKIVQVASTANLKEEPREEGEEVKQDYIKPKVDIIGTITLPRLSTVKVKWIYSQRKCLAMDCEGPVSLCQGVPRHPAH